MTSADVSRRVVCIYGCGFVCVCSHSAMHVRSCIHASISVVYTCTVGLVVDVHLSVSVCAVFMGTNIQCVIHLNKAIGVMCILCFILL